MNESLKKTLFKYARQVRESMSAFNALKLDYALVFVMFGKFLMS
jgi:hypothetical protein